MLLQQAPHGMVIEAVRTQGRVLMALMLRDARTRYGTRRIGYVWALLEPLIHITGFSLLFYFTGRVVAIGDSLLIFLATGVSTFVGFRNVLSRTRGSLQLQAVLGFPIVKLQDVFLARAILELATWLMSSMIILGVLIFLGFGPLPRDIFMMIQAVAALFSIGFGFGIVIGVASEFVPSISSFMRLLSRLLYLTSGLFFLPDTMAPTVREIIAWNPVLHGIALYRMGYYDFYDSTILDMRYLTYWAVGCLLVGLLSIRVMQKAIRSMP